MQNLGVYFVRPHWIEFWQGHSNRLHDRVVFSTVQFDREEISPKMKTLSFQRLLRAGKELDLRHEKS